MLQRIRKFAIELHEDESGPNTVEWVLLIIIALILLVVILLFAKWVIDKFKEKKQQVETDPFMQE